MYTPGTIANSQRTPAKINKKGATLFFFYKNNFIRKKALVLVKKIKNKLRTKPGLLFCSAKHKKKVSRLTISKIIESEHQNRAWHLHCTAYRLVLFSHFNITKLFNDHILFVCLLYIGQSSFTFLPL